MTEPHATADRAQVLQSLAAEFLAEEPGRLLIAVDGVDGSGKSTFANDLAEVIRVRPVIVIHADDFLNLRAARHRRGRDSPEGFWLDTYDYETLFRQVLFPLRRGGSGSYRPVATDHHQNITLDPPSIQAAENAVVIVEGMFLHRDELVGCWDYSCFLDVPFTETARRMSVRDGSHPDPEHHSMRRYVGGQRLYFEAAQPWKRATRVVDNTNPEVPLILLKEEVLKRRRPFE